MRIQLVTHSFGPEVSPPQRRWRSFVDIFLENGLDVDVVAPSDPRNSKWAPFTVDELNRKRGRFAFFGFNYRTRGNRWFAKIISHFAMVAFMVPRALKTDRPELIVVTVPALPSLVAGHLISRLRRVPLVVEMRDAWPELLEESHVIPLKFLQRLAARTITYMQNSAVALIAVTNGQARILEKNGARNVQVVSNGYRFESLCRTKSTEPRTHKRLRVLYLGNLGESQGLSKVLQIAALSKEWMELKIVGEGSALPRLKTLAAELTLGEIFEDPVKNERVLDWYDWADTCLVSLRDDWPSFQYTIPSKLFELAGYQTHITGLVQGESADVIRQYGLGTTLSGDVISMSRDLKAQLSDIRSWKPQADKLSKFKEIFEHGSLGVRYIQILRQIISDGRTGIQGE